MTQKIISYFEEISANGLVAQPVATSQGDATFVQGFLEFAFAQVADASPEIALFTIQRVREGIASSQSVTNLTNTHADAFDRTKEILAVYPVIVHTDHVYRISHRVKTSRTLEEGDQIRLVLQALGTNISAVGTFVSFYQGDLA